MFNNITENYTKHMIIMKLLIYKTQFISKKYIFITIYCKKLYKITTNKFYAYKMFLTIVNILFVIKLFL